MADKPNGKEVVIKDSRLKFLFISSFYSYPISIIKQRILQIRNED